MARETPHRYAISTVGLTKAYGNLVAVDDLDFRVSAGEIYGLIGPNGAGKTTLIKILVGILKPDGGEAYVLGRSAFDPASRTQRGYMPQEVALYPDLTVEENIRFFAEIQGSSKAGVKEAIQDAISLVDLIEKADTVASELSGGLLHRLSLACAVIHDPSVLFLDEPTVGVDPELRISFWSYFRRLANEGKTILISTHYMDEAAKCTRIGMIHHGKIMAEGEPDEVMVEAGCQTLENAFLHYSRSTKGGFGH